MCSAFAIVWFLTEFGVQYDYTKGQLPELIDVIIEEKTSLFVCAIGVPPKPIVDKLHKAGIPIMNVSLIAIYAHSLVRMALARWSDTPTMYQKL